MAFSYTNSKGKTYFLNKKTFTRKSGKSSVIYFFSSAPGASAIDALPPGFKVAETKTGLPVLKKQ